MLSWSASENGSPDNFHKTYIIETIFHGDIYVYIVYIYEYIYIYV